LARAKLKANEKQVEGAERRFAGGDGVIPDVREARSRRDLARADLIKAEDARIVALRELQEMIGYTPVRLTALKRNFRPQPLVPQAEASWLAMAMADNPEIRSAMQDLRVSDHEIDRAFGGHLPTLDLVVARRDVDAETISTRDQSSNTTDFGFELVLPIYSGGRVSAQVEQARYNRERAEQELAATRERVAVEVARQYQGVVTGARRIEALESAVASGEEALKATEMGYRLGTRTILDVLDAEDRVFQSRLDLTEARLKYTLAHLSLAAAVGRLDSAAIQQVDTTYFGPEQVAWRGVRQPSTAGSGIRRF
jgi:protease secretion system outer membrane protein